LRAGRKFRLISHHLELPPLWRYCAASSGFARVLAEIGDYLACLSLSALLSCIAVELEGSGLRPNAALGKLVL